MSQFSLPIEIIRQSLNIVSPPLLFALFALRAFNSDLRFIAGDTSVTASLFLNASRKSWHD
ncbi:hypothetical protein FACS1894102_3360 [Spirochaetia bacterium]|nr:hypothetical protein FACS1894102_3360 [Spirochaetia bacterium]